MAVLAVCCEPVSRFHFPVNREDYREYLVFDRFFDARMGKRGVIPATYIEIP